MDLEQDTVAPSGHLAEYILQELSCKQRLRIGANEDKTLGVQILDAAIGLSETLASIASMCI